MTLSVFDLFSVGIGPSSSHTVGPMRAARRFVDGLINDETLSSTRRVHVELFGSLGATGRGHGSPQAVVMGLQGADPETCDPDLVPLALAAVRASSRLTLAGSHEIEFSLDDDLVMHRRKRLPFHANGMTFAAFDGEGTTLRERVYYSIGGGFVVDERAAGADRIVPDTTVVKHPFRSSAQLLAACKSSGLRVSDVMLENELAWRTEAQVRGGLVHLWEVMSACIARGIGQAGVLPGGLGVRRRAGGLNTMLLERDAEPPETGPDPLRAMEWVTLFALAVNEENASGGRVVTAPTNGAAGIVPAVLMYYWRFVPGATVEGVVRFLLAAAAFGVIVKENASISGAEVGCQGEVGSACSMAAAGLAEVLGGTPSQVENAAEIAMEHNLGLTCDPIGGLVQIPCIERNALAAVKAITAARMALLGDGEHFVSFDKVVRTMRQTGADMKDKYKETARGGLAVNIIEC